MRLPLSNPPQFCPKTGKPLPPAQHFPKWLFPLAGLLALAWFLIRVIPKPRRAAYPCMRVASPLAGSFLAWLAALGTTLALRRVVTERLRRMHRAALRSPLIVWVVCCVLGCAVAFLTQPAEPGLAQPPLTAAQPGHPPLGIARGLKPGRVVWVHDPAVTDWAGPNSGERWYEHTDPKVAAAMVSRAIRAYAGTGNDVEAWEQIFRYFNRLRKGVAAPYSRGEKIVVKINLSTCNAGGGTCDANYHKLQLVDSIDNSPQILHALLEQLVHTVGAAPRDITVGDPTALFPDYLYDYLHRDFPEVRYWDNRGTHSRYRAEFSNRRFYWSTAAAANKTPDLIPRSYLEAAYVINAAILKGHSAGVTLCAKNNYGSLIRTPGGYLARTPHTQNYYDLHQSLPNPEWSPGRGKYRALVDLMGHPDLGDKTVLYIVDGLFGGYYWDAVPRRWRSAPFDGAWPASLLVSMDPVAVDSVGYDFLAAEWPDVVAYGAGKRSGPGLAGGAEDYLHEAALADHPPSGVCYDPTHDGRPLASLGVHEHWNNARDKNYSRNLGTGNGIELVKQ